MKLELLGTSYVAGGVTILSPVELFLAAGERCVLLGPNGAGKSTLMKIASGYLTADSGDVRLGERELSAIDLAERAMMLGVLTQRNDLDFPFTAAQVIAMGRTPYGPGRADDPIVVEVIERLQIRGDRIYTSLSGGEKQLVQLARVFAQVWDRGPGAFLLLDEPMTALDLNHQQVVVALLQALGRQGMGQLVVMHDINMAADIADRIVLMKAGSVVASGPPNEVLSAESLELTFGTPMSVLTDGSESFYKAAAVETGRE